LYLFSYRITRLIIVNTNGNRNEYILKKSKALNNIDNKAITNERMLPSKNKSTLLSPRIINIVVFRVSL
jgi:hypothetical protein